MSPARTTIISLSLLLLMALGAGIYLYQNLPSLIQQQALIFLGDYGLDDLNYARPQLSRNRIRIDSLQLRGEYEGLSYDLDLSAVEIHYDLNTLRAGKLKSAQIGSVAVSLVQRPLPPQKQAAETLTISELLPDFQALPIETLAIKRWKLDFQPADLPLVTVQGQVRLDKNLQLHLVSSYSGADIIADISTEGAQALPRAAIRINKLGESIGQLQASLNPAGTDSWQWHLEGSTQFVPLLSWLQSLDQFQEDRDKLSALTLQGQGSFELQINHPDRLHVTEPTSATTLSQFTVTARATQQIDRLDFDDAIADLNGQLRLELELADSVPRVNLSPGRLSARISTSALPANITTSLNWGTSVPLVWTSNKDIKMTSLVSGDWSIDIPDSKVLVGEGDSEFRLEALSVEASATSGDDVAVSADLNGRLNGQLSNTPLPPFKLAVTHRGTMEESHIGLSLKDVAESMSANIEGELNMNTGQGNYSVALLTNDLPYASESLIPLLRRFSLLDKRDNVGLSSGELELHSQLQSTSFDLVDLKQQAHLSIENISGSYNDYSFEGLTLSAGWKGIEEWQTIEPVKLSLQKLDVGFALTDTSLRLSLPIPTPINQPDIHIEQFTTEVFGGELFLPKPQPWNFSAASNTFTLKAENWQLGELVALQTDQDIKARGTLEGELPVTLKNGRIIIASGYLQALAPGGHIRYIANEASVALASSSPELKLALNLLDDFQYKILSTQVKLDEGGNLFLGLSLEGSNPSQHEGRPINFNINLEQNIDPLLQSLRISDKLVEQIEDRIN